MKKIITLIAAIIAITLSQAQGVYTLSVEINYDSIFSLDGRHFAVKQNGKWGVAKERKEVLPCIYEGIDALGDGVISVINQGKIGFVDTLGNTLLEPTYTIEKQANTEDKSQINVYDNGACLVEVEGKYQLIDKQNHRLIPQDYEIISRIGDAVAIKKNGKYGIANSKGQILLYPQYLDISILIESKLYSYKQISTSGLPVFGLINGKGQVISPAIYADFGIYNGKEATYIKAYEEDGRQALLNEEGKTIVPAIYQVTLPTILPDYFSISQNLEHGIIGKDSVIYVPPAYERVEIMQSTETFFLAHKENKTHIYNTSQEHLATITGTILDVVSNKKSDVYFVIEHNFSYGIQDTTGKWIIEPIYDEILSIIGDNVCFRKKDKWGVINMQNQEVIPFQYKEAKLSPSKKFLVLYDGKKDSKLLNEQGQIISFSETESILISNNYIEYKDKKAKRRLYENGTYQPDYIQNIKAGTNDILCIKDQEGWTYAQYPDFKPLTTKHYQNIGLFFKDRALVYQDNQLKEIDNKFNQQSVVISEPISNIEMQLTYIGLHSYTGAEYYIIKNKNKYGVITIKQ